MKTLVLASMLILAAAPVLATPFCHSPRSGNIVVFEVEIGKMGEIERAQYYESRLRMLGIDVRHTAFWNECIQAIVRENGRISMRFYDPWSLEEIPVN